MIRLMLSVRPFIMMGRKVSSVKESFRCILDPSVLDRVRTMTKDSYTGKEEKKPFSEEGEPDRVIVERRPAPCRRVLGMVIRVASGEFVCLTTCDAPYCFLNSNWQTKDKDNKLQLKNLAD